MARDVLPWQPSSTDPVMGCLVCHCDSFWTDECVEGFMFVCVCVCASLAAGLCKMEREKEREKQIEDGSETKMDRWRWERLVWRRHANHLIRLFSNWRCGGEPSAYGAIVLLLRLHLGISRISSCTGCEQQFFAGMEYCSFPPHKHSVPFFIALFSYITVYCWISPWLRLFPWQCHCHGNHSKALPMLASGSVTIGSPCTVWMCVWFFKYWNTLEPRSWKLCVSTSRRFNAPKGFLLQSTDPRSVPHGGLRLISLSCPG